MNLTEYQQATKQYNKFQPIETKQQLMIFASYGLVNESIELLSSNTDDIPSEIGDCFYYLSELANALEIDLSSLELLNKPNKLPMYLSTYLESDLKLIVIKIGLLNEYIKKWIYHGKAYDHQKIIKLLTDVLNSFMKLEKYGYNIDQILSDNIAKVDAKWKQLT